MTTINFSDVDTINNSSVVSSDHLIVNYLLYFDQGGDDTPEATNDGNGANQQYQDTVNDLSNNNTSSIRFPGGVVTEIDFDGEPALNIDLVGGEVAAQTSAFLQDAALNGWHVTITLPM